MTPEQKHQASSLPKPHPVKPLRSVAPSHPIPSHPIPSHVPPISLPSLCASKKTKKKWEETCSSRKLFPTNANDVASAADNDDDAECRCDAAMQMFPFPTQQKDEKKSHQIKNPNPAARKRTPDQCSSKLQIRPARCTQVRRQSVRCSQKEKPISAETFGRSLPAGNPRKKNRKIHDRKWPSKCRGSTRWPSCCGANNLVVHRQSRLGLMPPSASRSVGGQKKKLSSPPAGWMRRFAVEGRPPARPDQTDTSVASPAYARMDACGNNIAPGRRFVHAHPQTPHIPRGSATWLSSFLPPRKEGRKKSRLARCWPRRSELSRGQTDSRGSGVR